LAVSQNRRPRQARRGPDLGALNNHSIEVGVAIKF
jgi:hypothetical protein